METACKLRGQSPSLSALINNMTGLIKNQPTILKLDFVN